MFTEMNATKFDDVDLPVKWPNGSKPSGYDKISWDILRGNVVLNELISTYVGCEIVDNYPNNNNQERSALFPENYFKKFLGTPVTVLA